jgi:hypothetical protein
VLIIDRQFNVKGKSDIKKAYDLSARMSSEKPKILNKLTSYVLVLELSVDSADSTPPI